MNVKLCKLQVEICVFRDVVSCNLTVCGHFGGTPFLYTENEDYCVLYCDVVQSGRNIGALEKPPALIEKLVSCTRSVHNPLQDYHVSPKRC